MKINILFDSKRADPGYFSGWGVSYLIDNNILFDTGENAALLFINMYQACVKVNDINTVVISHDHFDHTGGLWDLLQQKQGIDLYICPDFSRQFKDKAKAYRCNLIEIDSFTKIADNIYSTGQIEETNNFGSIAEQALVLKTENGLTIITGCAHNGIVKIVEYIKQHIDNRIHLIMGGFHLIDENETKIKQIINKLKKFEVQYVGSSHCTGENASKMFRETYKENYVEIVVDQTIEV